MMGKKNVNKVLTMHPLQRILVSLSASMITFFCVNNNHFDWIIIIPLLWVTFAITFIITSGIVFFKLPVSEIVKKANHEDGSRFFVLISILLSSFASIFSVSLLMLSDKMQTHETLSVLISVLGMIASWMLVHTIFTFHYAHMYYFNQRDEKLEDVPLIFSGTLKPDYLDFAYFSFVIGMTFQVSDVEIVSQRMRRMALVHGPLSFILNTFVIALTINLIVGLKH